MRCDSRFAKNLQNCSSLRALAENQSHSPFASDPPADLEFCAHKKERKTGVTLTIYATVGTVSPSAHFWSTVYLNVVDNQILHIETFVFSITLGIPQQTDQKFRRLLRPSTLCCSKLFCLNKVKSKNSTKGVTETQPSVFSCTSTSE